MSTAKSPKKSDFLSVTDARKRILDLIKPLGTETVPLNDACGRVLALSPQAMTTQPPADMSSMDGYAVHADDISDSGTHLTLNGISQAGKPFAGSLPRGAAVRILTGAVVPDGATAVVMQEQTTVIDQHTIQIDVTPDHGANIRSAGQDFAAGDTLLGINTKLTARDVGLLAAMNVAHVTVSRKPVIAILATGDEIKPPGTMLEPGEIVGSSGPALIAMLRGWGCEIRDLGIVADERDALTTALQAAKGADLLLTTGGVSVGTHDLVRDVLVDQKTGAASGKLDFWRITMRPGKPLMAGELGNLPIIGLPGNPVSSIVCAILFAWPAVQKLSGNEALTVPTKTATLTHAMPANGNREHYMRARLIRNADGTLRVACFENQDSALMRVLAGADGLLIRPVNDPPQDIGTEVTILDFADFEPL